MFSQRQSPTTGKGRGGFSALSSSPALLRYVPHWHDGSDYQDNQPKRKNKTAPHDNGTFVLPLKQSMIRNDRLSPGARIMLCQLAGWAGKGGSVRTTTTTIGSHIGRSSRQVSRYLADCIAEGYLVTRKVFDRMGFCTGLKIFINFLAVRHFYGGKKTEKRPQSKENCALTYTSELNPNFFIKSYHSGQMEDQTHTMLMRIGQSLGVDTSFMAEPGG